jgi:hypothetical protein
MEVYMSVLDQVVLGPHDTEVLLYESHLEGYEGKLYARTLNDETVGYEKICVEAKERGGFTGNVEDLKNHTAVFLREMAYQLRDGRRVNIGGIFEASLDVGGWVEDEHSPIDPEENKLRVVVKPLAGARELVKGVRVVNRGLAPVQNYIMKIIDTETEDVNGYVTRDGLFSLFGHWIKIDGDDNKTGVVFYLPGTPATAIKAGKLATNSPSKLVGKVPELPPGKDFYIEVRTFYSGGGRLLKELRAVRSKFTVHQG